MINESELSPFLQTPINFGESCSSITFNVIWPEGIIDFSDQLVLNKDLLEKLLLFLKNNTKVGNIKWNEEQDQFDYTYCKIIKQLKKNNERFNYHPSDYLCGIIAEHVYRDQSILAKRKVEISDISVINPTITSESKLESIKNYLDQLEIINYINQDGFQYGLYENKEMHHLILAFRGTYVKNLKDAAYTIFEDAVGITLKSNSTFQVKKVIEVVKDVVEICKKKHYHLTITGHSLGAWLSEIAHHNCFYTHNFTHVKTVTFDSPGGLDQFKVIDGIIKREYGEMDIVSYLTEPNFINSMNNHIFENNSTFRVYPDGVEKVENEKMDFLISAKFHSLGLILDCFDFSTGKPKKYKVVKKWPLIDMKNISSYLSYFKNNDNGALENSDSSISQELAQQVHYQVDEINYYIGNLNLLDSIKIDTYLHQLSRNKNIIFSKFNDYFISTQLKELKQLYQINDDGNQLFIENQLITFELLKQRFARIINLNPKGIKKLLSSSNDTTSSIIESDLIKEYKIRIDHLSINGFYDSNDYISKLSEIHKNSNLAILSGEEGSGKSVIALEYAINHLPKLKPNGIEFSESKVLFIRGGSREMIFEDFSNHLLKNFKNEHNGYDFQLSSNHLIDFYKFIMDSQDTFYCFIFDNVEDFTLIEPFIFYLPKLNTKTIITCQIGKYRIDRVLSLGKQNSSEITVHVSLLTNKQANDYLLSRGIKNSNCNFSSPISIHLLNILINHFNSNNSNETTQVVDFNKTLSNLILEFIKLNPDSLNLLKLLPFLDGESIQYEILKMINPNLDLVSNVKYWSDISIINDLPGDNINTYKYIQQLIIDEILLDTDKQSIIASLIGIYSNLNLSVQHPKGWRIYFNHLKYFYQNFNQQCIENVQIIENLGICYRLCSQYQESIKHLTIALEIKKKSNNDTLANTLFQIANSYKKGLEFENALSYYKLVLLENNNNNQELISKTFNEIGSCLFNLNQFDLAMDNYEESLKTNHGEELNYEILSSIHLNIGDVYLEKNQLVNAKQEYLISLNLIESVSNNETTNPLIAKSNFKLAIIEFKESNFKLAIEKFNKSISLYKELYKSSLHKDVAICYQSIGLCYLNDESSASMIENDASSGGGVLKLSLDNLQQSLNIRLKIHRTNLNHLDLLESYLNLANCYKQRKEYKESLLCFKKSYEIQKSNNGNLILILQSLSTISFLSKDYNSSIEYSNKLLSKHLQFIDQFTISSIYKNIAENYKLLSDNENAKLNFQNSINILLKLIKNNESKINISSLKKNEISSNLELLLATLKLYEFIGSVYFSLLSITIDSKLKNEIKNQIQNYFNILISFENLLPTIETDKFLLNSNWFNQYKKSNSTLLKFKKFLIISSILIILISYYKLNKDN